MIDSPLRGTEIQRHVDRIGSVMLKLRKKKGMGEVGASGPYIQVAAEPQYAGSKTETLRKENKHTANNDASQPREMLTEDDRMIQQSLDPMRGYTLVPSQAAEADSDNVALEATSPGLGEQYQGATDIDNIEDGWNMVEANEKCYDSLAVEDMLEDLDVKDRDASQGKDSADWDLCG